MNTGTHYLWIWRSHELLRTEGENMKMTPSEVMSKQRRECEAGTRHFMVQGSCWYCEKTQKQLDEGDETMDTDQLIGWVRQLGEVPSASERERLKDLIVSRLGEIRSDRRKVASLTGLLPVLINQLSLRGEGVQLTAVTLRLRHTRFCVDLPLHVGVIMKGDYDIRKMVDTACEKLASAEGWIQLADDNDLLSKGPKSEGLQLEGDAVKHGVEMGKLVACVNEVVEFLESANLPDEDACEIRAEMLRNAIPEYLR